MTGWIRGITVRQPWAWYIAHGPKRIENRTWAPPRAAGGGYLAIHAGKALDPDEVRDAIDFVKALQAGGRVDPATIRAGKVRDLPRGAVVAVARLVGTVTASDDPWFCGPIGWQLADVVAIEPVPCRGAQGLWSLPPDVLATVRVRYRGARAGSAAGHAAAGGPP